VTTPQRYTHLEVEDLQAQVMAAEARREQLRRELAGARAAALTGGIEMLPAAVRKIVSDLRGMLAAGQVERVRSALCRLVSRIEVHEEPRPGRARPGAYLLVRGNLEAALSLVGAKVTSDGSPGGILTLLTFRLPPRCIRLTAWRHGGGLPRLQQRRAAASA
jgi:hypothetical protein